MLKDQAKETEITWNIVAELYEKAFIDLDLYNDSYDKFCELVPKGKSRILDIGCGPGNITRYLLWKRPDLEIHGIDYASNMIVLAKKNNPKANFSVINIADISSFSLEFNAIISGFLSPYLNKSQLSKMIKDCSDLLLDNGLIYISFVEGNYDESSFISGSSGERMFFYYHSLECVENELLKSDFRKKHIIHVEYQKKKGLFETHTILIYQKRSSN